MRISLVRFAQNGRASLENLIQITNGTFYRQHPGLEDRANATALFQNLHFTLPAKPLLRHDDGAAKQQHWAVIGVNGITTFLELLRGTHLCLPPTARSYPYLASDELEAKGHWLMTPSRAIQYVGFNTGKAQTLGSGTRGAYLSARYESRREETDWSVLQYLKGETELNPSDEQLGQHVQDEAHLCQVMKDLRLEKMASMPVSNLSNGQTRCARIAKALLSKPELLLLDEPFMGLDPPTLVTLSPMLRDLAYKSSPRLFLALRPQDPIPDWITHLIVLGKNHSVALMGPKEEALFLLHRWAEAQLHSDSVYHRIASEMTKVYGQPLREVGHVLTSGGIRECPQSTLTRPFGIPPIFTAPATQHQELLSTDTRKLLMEKLSTSGEELTLPQVFAIIKMTQSISPGPTRAKGQHINDDEPAIESSEIPGTALFTSKPAEAISRSDSSSIESLIELSGVVVKYGDKTVLGNPPPQKGYSTPGLHLTVRRGTRLALLGPNGSGKTTLLSLLTSDHPHSYSLPIKFFGRLRLPEPGSPGLSLWDIQSRIGHSSPEIHAFFPKHLPIRKVLESAWADTLGGKPNLSHERDELVDRVLRWWEPELRKARTLAVGERTTEKTNSIILNDKDRAMQQLVSQSYPPLKSPSKRGQTSRTDLDWASDTGMHAFGVLPFGTQRLLLFLRAIIKCPDIIILDEALSGLSPDVREKAICYLEHGEAMFLRQLETESTLRPARTRNMRPALESFCSNLGITLSDLLEGSGGTCKVNNVMGMTREQFLEGASFKDVSSAESDSQFSGLSPSQALVVVSHVREEIPRVVDEWLRLPSEEEVVEQGRGVEMGRCDGGTIRTVEGWKRVWGF